MGEFTQQQLNEEISCPWCEGPLGRRGDTPREELVSGTHFHYCPHCTKMFAVARGRFYRVFLELGNGESAEGSTKEARTSEESASSWPDVDNCHFCGGPLGGHRGAVLRYDAESDEGYPVRVCKSCDPWHKSKTADPTHPGIH